jgi:hypothetical protein
MEFQIGKVIISKKALFLIAYTLFIQSVVLGAYYAATGGFKEVIAIPFLYMAMLSTIVVLYKPLRNEIRIEG